MVMFKKVKTFLLAFSEPEKVYCSGEKVAGRVLVEVAEVTRVSAVKVLACGVAKVNWAKGPQQCRQEMEYLRFEDVLTLEEQPTGEGSGLGKRGGCGGVGPWWGGLVVPPPPWGWGGLVGGFGGVSGWEG